MAIQLLEYPSRSSSLKLRVAHGHFATSHSHINCYLDLTMTKHRLSEAQLAAEELSHEFSVSTIVDTILCLDGTEVIGTCMATTLTQAGFTNMNAHRTIYVATPNTSGNRLIVHDNSAPMIAGKHVLLLAASVTTGYTVKSSLDAIRYYSGIPVGVCAIFSCIDECEGFPVKCLFSKRNDLDYYESWDSNDCPMCRAGVRLDALVNTHGISSF